MQSTLAQPGRRSCSCKRRKGLVRPLWRCNKVPTPVASFASAARARAKCCVYASANVPARGQGAGRPPTRDSVLPTLASGGGSSLFGAETGQCGVMRCLTAPGAQAARQAGQPGSSPSAWPPSLLCLRPEGVCVSLSSCKFEILSLLAKPCHPELRRSACLT